MMFEMQHECHSLISDETNYAKRIAKMQCNLDQIIKPCVAYSSYKQRQLYLANLVMDFQLVRMKEVYIGFEKICFEIVPLFDILEQLCIIKFQLQTLESILFQKFASNYMCMKKQHDQLVAIDASVTKIMDLVALGRQSFSHLQRCFKTTCTETADQC